MVMYRKKQGVITAVQDNLEHTYGNNFQVLEPYMLYGDRSAMENLPKMQREHMLQDLESAGNVSGTYEADSGICDGSLRSSGL